MTSIPFVLFAAREAVQESLGFSPFELVFGHPVLKLIKERWVNDEPMPNNMSEYVAKMRKTLSEARELVRDHQENSQKTIKAAYDKKTIEREFKEGEEVLLLLPLNSQPFKAR